MSDEVIRVLTWNLFHGQDGAGLGPTWASTLLKQPIDDGHRIHLNRKWIDEMADVIASRKPTIAALQEVPPLAVPRLAAATGMAAVHSLMPPLIGSTRLRGRLAARNPDLWRTHEGTANVLLVASPWQLVSGGKWTVRHNPPGFVVRNARRLGLGRRDALHWFLEPRRLVAARIRAADGRVLTAASLHCHNASDPEAIAQEVRRALPRVIKRIDPGEPLLVAGDLNAHGRSHPAIAELHRLGLEEDSLDERGIDHIFHRNLEVIDPPETTDPHVREHSVAGPNGPRIVVLSDHDLVEGSYRFRT